MSLWLKAKNSLYCNISCRFSPVSWYVSYRIAGFLPIHSSISPRSFTLRDALGNSSTLVHRKRTTAYKYNVETGTNGHPTQHQQVRVRQKKRPRLKIQHPFFNTQCSTETANKQHQCQKKISCVNAALHHSFYFGPPPPSQEGTQRRSGAESTLCCTKNKKNVDEDLKGFLIWRFARLL